MFLLLGDGVVSLPRLLLNFRSLLRDLFLSLMDSPATAICFILNSSKDLFFFSSLGLGILTKCLGCLKLSYFCSMLVVEVYFDLFSDR